MKSWKHIVKYYAYLCAQLICRCICIIPLKQNRIIFMSHRGASQYSDSPKFLSEYLLNHYPGQYEIIWEVNDLDKFSFLKEKGIRLVRIGSFADYYLLNTSKVCVTNCDFKWYLVKRKKQLRLNTWHGGFSYKAETVSRHDKKKVVSDHAKAFAKYKRNKYNVMLSGCEYSTKYNFIPNFMFEGIILDYGLPRNDSMFQSHTLVREKVKKLFGINDDENMLIVAPTWKDNDDDSNIRLNYEQLCNVLEEKTGTKWKVLLRLHHLSKIDTADLLERYDGLLYDATSYPNSEDLLQAADFLITDYSSVLWDFSLLKKPAVLFVPDLDDYANGRGFNIPIEDWGIKYAQTSDGLIDIIANTPFDELAEDANRHLETFGSYEQGDATERVVSYMFKYLPEPK